MAGAPKIDSNIVLVDPFGARPALITGAFGAVNSSTDLLIVDNASGLAAEQSVYVLGLFQHLAFRLVTADRPSRARFGLQASDSWQQSYFKQRLRTLDFLFGIIAPGL